MKKLLFLMGMAIFCVINCAGQYKDSLSARPKYEPFYIKPTGQLMSLEKSIADFIMPTKKQKQAIYVIKGEKAGVVLPSSDSIRLVFSTAVDMKGWDPGLMFHVYHLTGNNGNREAVLQSAGSSGKGGKDKINCLVRQDGMVIEFLIKEKLPPGEYAFLNLMTPVQNYSVNAYCFRVE